MLQRSHTLEGEPRPRSIDIGRRMVLLAALGGVGLLASGPNTGQEEVAARPPVDVATLEERYPTLSQDLSGPQPTADKLQFISADSGSKSKKDKCTTLRIDGMYIISAGKTCVSEGAKAAKVDGGYNRFGWIYSVVYIDGVTKCAYIKPKVLPERIPAKQDLRACRGYLPDIRARRYIKNPNCGDIKGIDACVDGNYRAPVTKTCTTRGVGYKQFATKEKSPWNVYGVKAPRLSRRVSDNKHESVNFRGLYAVKGEPRKAISVRTSEGWAIMSPTCVSKQDRFGGTCKNNAQNRDEYGNIVCGNADEVRKDAHKWLSIRRSNVKRAIRLPLSAFK